MRMLSFLSGFFFVATACAQAQDKNAELQKRVDGLATKVGERLGIKLKNSIPAAYQSREDFLKKILADIDKEFPAEKRQAMTHTFSLLGLLPADFDLRKVFSETASTQVAAYYDPETKKMFVVEEGLEGPMLDIALFHELVHAIQDQEHNLEKTMGDLNKGDNQDAANAYHFLAEGEASFWMQINALESMGRGGMKEMAFNLTKDLNTKGILALMENQPGNLSAKQAEQLKKVPPLIVRTFVDPYLRGTYTAYRLEAKGGRDVFRRLFQTPPTNMRDLMFVDDYLKSPRGFATVQLAGLQEALGKEWKRMYEDTLGALGLHILFEDQKAIATKIAKGWNGDRIEGWEKGDERLAAGLATFETPEAAQSFAKQLERLYREQWTKGAKIEEHDGPFTHLSAGTDRFVSQIKEKTVAYARGTLPTDPTRLVNALFGATLKAFPASPLPEPVVK